MAEFIKLSQRVADGISAALMQDFNIFETPERMAWIVWLLKYVEDSPNYFPAGKWATIQNIELQIYNRAIDTVEELRHDHISDNGG